MAASEGGIRMTSERALFLKAFMAHPREMGSITPSSRYLTKRMLNRLPWDSMKSVVELGAGTGVFTEHILEYKRDDCKFLAIEKNELLYRRLQVLYPAVLMGDDALKLAAILQGYGMGAVDCIISALPFALMTKEERQCLIAAISRSMNDGGTFIM
jgi:phospholipid N-methyltransferase